MSKTLQRDWWKLLLIVLVGGGLAVLMSFDMWRLYAARLSQTQVYIIISLLAFLEILLIRVLPVFIHEQKNLWDITWKYLVLRIGCEVILTKLLSILPVYEVRPLFIAVMSVFFIVVFTLFLGFLCAAANSTGLLAGIKTLITKYFLKYICILLIVWSIQKLPTLLINADFMRALDIEVDFLRGVLSAIIQIAIVYICLPLFKEPAK